MSERAKISGWLTGRLPEDWFTEPVEVTVDRDEITIIGRSRALGGRGRVRCREGPPLTPGRSRSSGSAPGNGGSRSPESSSTRPGERWPGGFDSGDQRELFTTLSVPVMTRLRQADRAVLDTLVDAGVARSRSEALAWCVRLVGKNAETWLAELREAMQKVEQVRESGPDRTTMV